MFETRAIALSLRWVPRGTCPQHCNTATLLLVTSAEDGDPPTHRHGSHRGHGGSTTLQKRRGHFNSSPTSSLTIKLAQHSH